MHCHTTVPSGQTHANTHRHLLLQQLQLLDLAFTLPLPSLFRLPVALLLLPLDELFILLPADGDTQGSGVQTAEGTHPQSMAPHAPPPCVAPPGAPLHWTTRVPPVRCRRSPLALPPDRDRIARVHAPSTAEQLLPNMGSDALPPEATRPWAGRARGGAAPVGSQLAAPPLPLAPCPWLRAPLSFLLPRSPAD